MDKRRDPRAGVSFPVDVLNFSARTRDEGRFVDVGAGGACLELSGSYEIGSPLRLVFNLPSTPGEIACTGIVRDACPGVRVEFLRLEPEDQHRISEFVTRDLSE